MCKSILVIDDYPLNLMVAKMVIKHQGAFDKIATCLQAQTALDTLVDHAEDKDELPDVILLDLNMPVVDGWQFLIEFEAFKHSLTKSISIFILSSSVDIRDVERSKQFPSVKGYLSKPLTPDMIIDISGFVAKAI